MMHSSEQPDIMGRPNSKDHSIKNLKAPKSPLLDKYIDFDEDSSGLFSDYQVQIAKQVTQND